VTGGEHDGHDTARRANNKNSMNGPASVPIPPRPARSSAETPRVERTDAPPLDFSSVTFSEIEYDSAAPAFFTASGDDRQLFFTPPPQKIEKKPPDPLKTLFYEMRSLARGVSYGNYDSELFYAQAKFMEDFTDDYGGAAAFFSYYPLYQQMDYAQLRTYFTWRAGARRGDYTETSKSYVYLYIYELLSNVGVGDPAEGLRKLTEVLGKYRDDASIMKYLLRWLRDYHVYYDMTDGFAGFARDYGLEKYYPDVFLTSGDERICLEVWNSISKYDITKNKFYIENGPLTRECFCHTVGRLRELCGAAGTRLEELIYRPVGRELIWLPFERALFNDHLRQPDRDAGFFGKNVYFHRDGRWTVLPSALDDDGIKLAGYVVKKTESRLRELMRYKYKSDADYFSLSRATRERLEDAGIRLDLEIDAATGEFYKNKTRTVVSVDLRNLSRIREEALGTQERLIIREDADDDLRAAEAEPTDDAIDEVEREITSDAGRELIIESPNTDEPRNITMSDADSLFPDVWNNFVESLTATEKAALAAALSGGDMARALRDANAMPEVFFGSINEKAADHIGDSILEYDGVLIFYEDYLPDLRRLFAIN